MTSKTIIKTISESTGYTQKEITEILDAIEVLMKTELPNIDGAKFKVLDITFENVVKEARKGINPRTKEIVTFPEGRKLRIGKSVDWNNLFR